MDLLILFVFCFVCVSSIGLNEEFTWSRLSYQWPKKTQQNSRSGHGYRSQSGRPSYWGGGGTSIAFESTVTENAGNQGSKAPERMDYQYENNIPMGANVWRDKLFISVPRRRVGIPSTLNYVPLKSIERHNVPLIPYPNWDINLFPDTSGSGDNFVSVYRIVIDACDRMWLVDTGVIEIVGNRTIIKPHQLIIINLQTDQIIHRFTLPENVLTPATVLASLTVDTTKRSCEDAFVYFPDLAGYGLVVYSLKENRAWRIRHNYFYLESLAGEFFIAGYNFQLPDGVFSVELSDLKVDGYRDAYFHSLAGTHMFKVSTRVLRNETLGTRRFHEDDFTILGDKGANSQTSTADLHKPTGTMFMGLVNQNAVGCWNIDKNLKTVSIVHRDDERMIYPSDVKISGDRVYVLTNTMPGFLFGRLNYDITNFRVWSNDVRSAIRGTKC